MQLGITVDPLSPDLTGIGRYTLELCRGMARNPAIDDLRFFLADHWISRPEALVAGTLQRRSRLPKFARSRWARGGFRNRLIHGTNYFLPASAETGVVTVHDLSIYLHAETHPVERVRDFEKRFGRSLEVAAHVITDSEATRRDLITHLSYPADTVTTVHLGVSRRFQQQEPASLNAALARILTCSAPQYILSVATFEPRKRIEAAILAHAHFCDRTGRDIPLVLVGAKGWRNEALHALIESEQRKGRLIMLGFVPEADLPIVYAGASLFLYPSIYEGFGLPPIEAMACGTPVITSDRSCLPEVTRGAAMLIDPDDIDAFGASIERALDDDMWRDGAIRAGLAVAAHYSWERCVEKTISVYRRCNDGAD